jgi:tRNA (guanine37-N1)-methyltransferase
MRLDIVTLFPEMFPGYLGQSLLHQAIENQLIEVHLHDLRQWGDGKHKMVDDRPYGGGPGMLLKVEPVVAAAEAVMKLADLPTEIILLTPRGERLTQHRVEQFATRPRMLILCGRYEGFDQRVIDILKPTEVSIGDYVLGGGEVAAMVLVDAVARLIPGVIGDEESSKQDSFSGEDRRIEFPQYTRPREFRGLTVPEVLISGHHAAIEGWRKQQSEQITKQSKQ